MDTRIAKLASPPPGALKFAEHLKACYDREFDFTLSYPHSSSFNLYDSRDAWFNGSIHRE